jgi:hypothetical protein
MGVEDRIGKEWEIGDLYLIQPTETKENCIIKSSFRTDSFPPTIRNKIPPPPKYKL